MIKVYDYDMKLLIAGYLYTELFISKNNRIMIIIELKKSFHYNNLSASEMNFSACFILSCAISFEIVSIAS